MVLTISDEEFLRMKTAALDGDKQEALRLIRGTCEATRTAKATGIEIAP